MLAPLFLCAKMRMSPHWRVDEIRRVEEGWILVGLTDNCNRVRNSIKDHCSSAASMNKIRFDSASIASRRSGKLSVRYVLSLPWIWFPKRLETCSCHSSAPVLNTTSQHQVFAEVETHSSRRFLVCFSEPIPYFAQCRIIHCMAISSTDNGSSGRRSL